METKFAAFGELERNGWSDETCVANYVDLFAPISDQAISGLISAASVEAGCRALDLLLWTRERVKSALFARL